MKGLVGDAAHPPEGFEPFQGRLSCGALKVRHACCGARPSYALLKQVRRISICLGQHLFLGWVGREECAIAAHTECFRCRILAKACKAMWIGVPAGKEQAVIAKKLLASDLES